MKATDASDCMIFAMHLTDFCLAFCFGGVGPTTANGASSSGARTGGGGAAGAAAGAAGSSGRTLGSLCAPFFFGGATRMNNGVSSNARFVKATLGFIPFAIIRATLVTKAEVAMHAVWKVVAAY